MSAVGHLAQVTSFDLVQRLLSYLGGNAEGAAHADIKRAVIDAYREMPGLHAWTYFVQIGRIFLNPAYSTGTIAYDHCVTREHEALTKGGWKTHDELAIGEEIMAYDPSTKTCRWSPIEHIHRSVYNGNLLEVKRRGRDILRCTENHRFPVSMRKGGAKRRSMQDVGFVPAKGLTDEHHVPLTAPFEFAEESILSPRLAAILAWAVTDGWGVLDREKAYGAGIAQSTTANPKNCAAIAALTQTKQRGPYAESCASWSIPAKTVRELRLVIKKASELPSLVVKLSREAAQAMYDAMLAAEGACTHAGRLRFSQWQEKRKPIAEAFQILANLLGRPANLTESHFEAGTRYNVTVRTSVSFKPRRNASFVKFKGFVWCPQVATGAWMCRCNGAVTITGNSGGANERQLTLTDGVWPSWASRGAIRIGSITSYVDQRVSDTVLTLDPMQNPGADVDSGTAFELVQDSYQLPIDFTAGDRGLPENAWGGMQYIRPADWLSMQRYSQVSGTAVYYTFTADPKAAGRLAMRLYPPPTSTATLDFIYRRRCRAIRVWEQTKGKASVTAGSNTITLSAGGTIIPAHVGSVIRLSDGATNPPTDLDGLYPYVVERTIVQRVSATEALVDDSVDDDYSSVAYRISDPVDVEPSAMYNALYTSAIRWLCIARNRKELSDAMVTWRFSLDVAKESDTRDMALDGAGGIGGGGPVRLLWRGPITAG